MSRLIAVQYLPLTFEESFPNGTKDTFPDRDWIEPRLYITPDHLYLVPYWTSEGGNRGVTYYERKLDIIDWDIAWKDLEEARIALKEYWDYELEVK